jgi:hypothetical protein
MIEDLLLVIGIYSSDVRPKFPLTWPPSVPVAFDDMARRDPLAKLSDNQSIPILRHG